MTSTPHRRSPTASTLATVVLLAVTAAWGSTFFLLKDVLERIPVSDFLAVRFALAAAAVWLLFPRCLARLTPRERLHGVLLGVVYGAAQIMQTTGLQTTAASVSGFITGMCVVFTPLLAALLTRIRIGRTVWTAVAVATLGLAVLSIRGPVIGADGVGPGVGAGEALTLVSALLYGAHILGLGLWSTGRSAVGLTVVQLLVITLVCALGAVPGGLVLPRQGSDWGALVFMALVAGAAALLAQTWAQAHLAATRAAIIMTMEPVWAAAFAVLLGGERLGPRTAVGGSLVLGAMYLAETGPRQAAGQDAARCIVDEPGRVTRVGPA